MINGPDACIRLIILTIINKKSDGARTNCIRFAILKRGSLFNGVSANSPSQRNRTAVFAQESEI